MVGSRLKLPAITREQRFNPLFCICKGSFSEFAVFYRVNSLKLGFPILILRSKEKKVYRRAFGEYRDQKNAKLMERIIYLALMESLRKRVTYLKGEKIITLSDYVRQQKKSAPAVLSVARRQNIPAFHERGIWKIGKGLKGKQK